MLNASDYSSLFDVSRRHGHEGQDLFIEKTQLVTFRFKERRLTATIQERTGMSLRCHTKNFFCTGLNPKDLAFVISNAPGDQPVASPFLKASPLLAHTLNPLRPHELSQFLKKIDLTGELDLSLVETRQSFWILHEGGDFQEGKNERAELFVHWPEIQHYTGRSDIDNLWKLLEEDSSLFARPLKRNTAWPLPTGNVPIYWSAKSLSKLLLPFIRAFEGDLLSGGRSFLSKNSTAYDFQFGILDKVVHIDSEGTSPHLLPLFDGKLPTAFACDRELASRWGSDSTGHCRRSAFDREPTIALWNAVIEPKFQSAKLLEAMQWGISVRDIDLTSNDPASEQIEFTLRDARLVHHGDEGEAVEPTRIQTHLPTLLQSIKVFSKNPQTMGHRIHKKSQNLLTEITTADALSENFPLPGTVPPSHYW